MDPMFVDQTLNGYHYGTTDTEPLISYNTQLRRLCVKRAIIVVCVGLVFMASLAVRIYMTKHDLIQPSVWNHHPSDGIW